MLRSLQRQLSTLLKVSRSRDFQGHQNFYVIPIFGEWLNNVFNKVDAARVEAVGPDVACAEWLLRNGGRVRFNQNVVFHDDYNKLPSSKSQSDTNRIEEIDATDSSISSVGFAHLHDLSHVRKVTLRGCRYVGDNALVQLVHHLNGSLEDLEIENCEKVTNAGIKCLVDLRRLKRLQLANLQGLREPEDLASLLRQALPKCSINF